jgi:hypothetical protein
MEFVRRLCGVFGQIVDRLLMTKKAALAARIDVTRAPERRIVVSLGLFDESRLLENEELSPVVWELDACKLVVVLTIVMVEGSVVLFCVENVLTL